MRKLILLLFIAVVGLFSSIIVVDWTQNAIVRSSSEVKTYGGGIHFVLPVVNKISYIYMNQRSSLLNLELERRGSQVKVLLNWHVVNPIKYDNAYNNLSFESQLVADIHKNLASTISTTSLLDLNQHGIQDSYNFSEIGVVVDKISILSIAESSVDVAIESKQRGI